MEKLEDFLIRYYVKSNGTMLKIDSMKSTNVKTVRREAILEFMEMQDFLSLVTIALDVVDSENNVVFEIK
jgi:uncharacterized membrane protein